MNFITHAFAEFGRTIGVPSLAPDSNGRLSLHIGDEQRLDFVVLEDAVLMLLTRALHGNDRLLELRRALDACHVRHGWNAKVRACLAKSGELVFIATVPAREFSPSTVEQTFNLLSRLHERVTTR